MITIRLCLKPRARKLLLLNAAGNTVIHILLPSNSRKAQKIIVVGVVHNVGSYVTGSNFSFPIIRSPLVLITTVEEGRIA